MKPFDKWSKEWCQGLLHDGDDSSRVAYLAAKAAWDAAQPRWQPIDSAPECGTYLVWGGEIGGEIAGDMKNTEAVKVDGRLPSSSFFYEEGVDMLEISDTSYYQLWVSNPTHWMPLPAAPQGDEK